MIKNIVIASVFALSFMGNLNANSDLAQREGASVNTVGNKSEKEAFREYAKKHQGVNLTPEQHSKLDKALRDSKDIKSSKEMQALARHLRELGDEIERSLGKQ